MTDKCSGKREPFRRGLILDVDGTLWDAVKEIADSWNEFGRDIPDITHHISYETMRKCLGKTMPQIADVVYDYLPEERRVEVLAGAMDYEIRFLWDHPGIIYPDVVSTLGKLKDDGWNLYIVSNCQKGYIEDFLHASGTEDLIEDHVCFEDTMQGKGYNIRLCVERNDLDYAFYVGDTAGDLEAAREAGIGFIFAAYGFGDVSGMDSVAAVIDTFGELPATAARLREG